MRRCMSMRMILILMLGTALSWTALGLGCNATFLSSTGMSSYVPSTPGANPYIILRFTNSILGPDQSPDELNQPGEACFWATWRYAGGGLDSIGGKGTNDMGAGMDYGVVLPCDLTVMTVGNVDDLTQPGAWITYNPGGESNVLQALPPMGRVLQNGVDFRCGDVITFMLEPNNAIPARFDITWRVDSGQNESGPYAGPDTFANLYRTTSQWEDQTGITIPYPYVP